MHRISTKVVFFCLFVLHSSLSMAAPPLEIDVRKSWPPQFTTVGEVVTYYLTATDYRLFLDSASSEIASLKVATLQTGEVKPLVHILLEIVPSQYSLVIDEERKLVGFSNE